MRVSRVGPSNELLLLRLDRPHVANAYTNAMLQRFHDAFTEARADSSLCGAIVTGTGRTFCAGADISELRKRNAEDALSLLSREVFDAWAGAPWPTIAAVNGPAVGGGFELALACDLRICTEEAFFQLPETKLGLLPAAGGIRRLVVEIGAARVKETAFFARKIDAGTALAWGLVTQVAQDTLAAAIELLASRGDRLAVHASKLLINESIDSLRGRGAEGLAQALLYNRQNAPSGEDA